MLCLMSLYERKSRTPSCCLCELCSHVRLLDHMVTNLNQVGRCLHALRNFFVRVQIKDSQVIVCVSCAHMLGYLIIRSLIEVKLGNVYMLCLMSLYECKSRTPSYRLSELCSHVRLLDPFGRRFESSWGCLSELCSHVRLLDHLIPSGLDY